MEFTEAIEIIKNIVPESSANEYDGIIVKRLEASNTLMLRFTKRKRLRIFQLSE